ncbi:MAG TPA: tetratricopeptide repeat protein [Desulfobacteraceae bacterium]|nr:tetratricopeptide repeat protein [Desulfobacteraceae bacterium]
MNFLTKRYIAMKVIIRSTIGTRLISRVPRRGFFAALLVFFVFAPLQIGNAEALLETVTIADNPASVSIDVTEKVPSKVIRVDRREVLIALKNIRAKGGLVVKGSPGGLVKGVAVENLQGKVAAIVVTGNRDFQKIIPSWGSSGRNLVVDFQEKQPEEAVPPAVPDRADREKSRPDRSRQTSDTGRASSLQERKTESPVPEKAGPAPVKERARGDKNREREETPEPAPVKRETSIHAGDISDLLPTVAVADCPSTEMGAAVAFMEKGLWKEAFDGLTGYIASPSPACLEQASFMRAHAFLMLALDGRANLVKAASFFNELLVDFPRSDLLPFAFASLGKIHWALKNPALAQGYFTIVRDRFPGYPGRPEVFYHLGRIYQDKGYTDKSLEYFEKVYRDFPENRYTVDAGLGLGKALYKKRRYIDSLNILSRLVQENPEKVYDSPELLLAIGNANFKLGRSVPARKNLMRVCNLFPGVDAKDMVLSRIGDTYAVEERLDKAMRIYRFVRDEFPGSEGFLASSMGLARYLDNREEQQKIYNMIKQDFPDHRLASVAMMRLAEIYDKSGEYEKCINEIENLLATHPRGLRYEAVQLMKKAYESLFDGQLKSDNYPDILQRYEAEQVMIDRIESRRIFLQVGLAYLSAGLHDQAFNQLIKAYKQYKRNQRPAGLLFGLGVAMDESGRDDDALKILQGYARRFPDGPRVPEARVRMGGVFREMGAYGKAADQFNLAYQAETDDLEKGKILAEKAGVYEQEGQWARASKTLDLAAKKIAAASGTHYPLLSSIYRDLGRSYIEQDIYVKGAEAFTMALKFSGNGNRGDIEFALGDAYQKANVLQKAKKAFENVAASDDSVWARLAKERLATLDLAEKVKNS